MFWSSRPGLFEKTRVFEKRCKGEQSAWMDEIRADECKLLRADMARGDRLKIRRAGKIEMTKPPREHAEKVDEHRSYAINEVAWETMQVNEAARWKKTRDGDDGGRMRRTLGSW